MADAATYQIEVQGKIGRRWRRWFDDLAVTVTEPPGAAPMTILTGRVADQAALLGTLQKLYTLGLPLLLVRRLARRKQEVHGRQDVDCDPSYARPR
jgi:hypothetical protein